MMSGSSKTAHSQRTGTLAAPAPRVEFIYTPPYRRIVWIFSYLPLECPAGGPTAAARVSIKLTIGHSEPSRGYRLGCGERLRGRLLTSHNAHYVTIEPRRRCNMSYRKG